MQYTRYDPFEGIALTLRCDHRWRQHDDENLEGPRPDFWMIGDDPANLFDVLSFLMLLCDWPEVLAEPGVEITEVLLEGWLVVALPERNRLRLIGADG